MAQMKPAQSDPTDLFGNPRVSPRQLMQQQLAALLQDTAARTASADPRTQGVSMMGAGIGGMLGNLLIEKGVLPKPPEMERAEKMEAARTAINEDATRQGIDPVKMPGEFADLAASHFLRAGDEQSAMKAIQWRNLQEANTRVAERERQQTSTLQAQELHALKDYTPESVQAFKQSGDYADLKIDPNASSRGRGDYFVPVQTAEGVRAFDARKGTIVDPATRAPVTKPVVGSASDPELQGRLAASKKSGEKIGESRVLLDGKMDAHEAVIDARSMLDKGIYTGALSDFRKNVAKLAPGMNKERVANTEQFLSHIGNVVIPRLKEFGGNDSNEELRYLQKVMGGDTSLEEPALRKILESTERKITRGIARTRKRLKGAGLPSDDTPDTKPAAPAPKPDIDALLRKYGKR